MTYSFIEVTRDGAVALIRLNRPEALNALNSAMLGEIAAAVTVAGQDDTVGCIVLTGGDKAFAAGADIREMAEMGFADMVRADLYAPEIAAIAASRKTVIAAVSGYALGGGCELALLADFIVASETAKFGLPETGLGIIPGMGGTQRLTRLVGQARALDLILTGRIIDAAEAGRAGLVARVVAPERLLAEALDAAGRIAARPALAIRAAREAVHAAPDLPLAEGLRLERALFTGLFATEDQKEGMRAFTEKRPPAFKGR
jgi:enoyl-CoA hydratase/carnithine racemase